MAFPAGQRFQFAGHDYCRWCNTWSNRGSHVFNLDSKRFAYQMVDMVTNSVWKLAVAFGAGNRLLARNIHRCACQASLGLSFAAILFLSLFGVRIYGYWTHHQVLMDINLFHLLLVEVLANAFWFTSSVVSIACNRHELQAMVMLLSTALSFPVACLLMLWLGLTGAGISLLMVDLCMIAYVLSHSLSRSSDMTTWLNFRWLCSCAPRSAAGTPGNAWIEVQSNIGLEPALEILRIKNERRFNSGLDNRWYLVESSRGMLETSVRLMVILSNGFSKFYLSGSRSRSPYKDTY